MQYGFIKNKGTKDALQHISDIIYKNLDASTPIAVTFLDLAKAFDTVNHKILLDKLFHYGIRGQAIDLMKSYLLGRQQRVRIDNVSSQYICVDTGVPQGTILGPLLFILYINDLLTSFPENCIVSYADDTAVISIDKTWTGVETKMNNYLNEIATWLSLNKLSLNITKTSYMTFGNYCDSVPALINIQINGKQLQRVQEAKYLGIILDFNMKWDKHINYLINKTKYLLFVFYKLAKIMTDDTLRMIYYALFHSVTCYGIIAWGGAYTNNLGLLQRLQNRMLKIINKNKFLTLSNPLRFDQQFVFESLRYHYNNLKSMFLESASVTRTKQLGIPRMNKTVSKKRSYIVAMINFNRLPNDLKVVKNIKYAKARFKKWIHEHL